MRDPIHQQRIIKIHEEMLFKITKNSHLMMPETYKFYSSKKMRKQMYDIHIYKTKEYISPLNLCLPLVTKYSCLL